MAKRLFFIILIFFLFAIHAMPVYAGSYGRSYQTYIQLATNALQAGNYEKALFYFETANSIDPSQERPQSYIRLLKRLQDVPVKVIKKEKRPIRLKKKHASVSWRPVRKKKRRLQKRYQRKETLEELIEKERDILLLDDALWRLQPNTTLEIEIYKSIILEGRDIKNFLIVTEGFIEVERIDRNSLKVTATKRGPTFLHIWDDKGRWTFPLKVILPFRLLALAEQEARETFQESYVPPFQFTYQNIWNSFYEGDSIRNLERKNLLFRQWTGVTGETPYGTFDTSAVFYKFDETTEVTSYKVGLSDGHIGDFKNFSIRGYDSFKRFSALSFPGRHFRGFLIDADAFHNSVRYSYFKGRDRSTFGNLAPGVIGKTESFFEGARLTLFPEKDHQYSLNYVIGFGEARENFLKDKVFSAETKHRFGDLEIYGELGYDEDTYARNIKTDYIKDNYSLRVNLRDIEKNYATITGRPVGRGELGGNILFDWDAGKYRLNTNLDIYRDREHFNPDNPHGANYEVNMSLQFPLTNFSQWSTSAFYVNTPQLLSPRENFRWNHIYSRTWTGFNKRPITFFIGNTLQRNRASLSTGSEFDRYSIMTGVRFPLTRQMSYFINYDYSWVKEKLSAETNRPNVLTTGVSFFHKFLDTLSGRFNLTYRDEESTDGSFSFLAGEDSIRGTAGLTYRPSPDFEIFLDGQMRNIWAENPEQNAFHDADIRLGVRSSWDMPFRWNPRGEIRGVVYKDIDGNKLRNENEPGIAGVTVNIGKKAVRTDEDGEYAVTVNAKKVRVSLDWDSLPEGYVSSTALIRDITIEHSKTETVNFGVTAYSGIYGVVYYDQNANGRYDAHDILIPKTKIVLDGRRRVFSDHTGSYFFENISPGKHTITLDVNTLPLEYLPLIKLETTVDVIEGTTYVFHIPLKKVSGK